MYKATVTYPYGSGRRVRSTHFAHTKLFAKIKAWFAMRYCAHKDFFTIDVAKE